MDGGAITIGAGAVLASVQWLTTQLILRRIDRLEAGRESDRDRCDRLRADCQRDVLRTITSQFSK